VILSWKFREGAVGGEEVRKEALLVHVQSAQFPTSQIITLKANYLIQA